MPRRVFSRMIEWIAANRLVLYLDKTNKIEFIMRRRREHAFLDYYAVSDSKFLPTYGASLSFPFFMYQGLLNSEDEIEEVA